MTFYTHFPIRFLLSALMEAWTPLAEQTSPSCCLFYTLLCDAVATLFSLNELGLSYRECTQSKKLLKSFMAKVETHG